MIFYLEQALLGLLALVFWECVLTNGISLDGHYRGGLGITIIGLFYLTGHAVYLTALTLPGPLTSLNERLAGQDSAADEPDKSDAAQSTTSPKTISGRANSNITKAVPANAMSSNRSVAAAASGSLAYATTPPALSARSFGSGGVALAEGSAPTGQGVAAAPPPVAMAASAGARGGLKTAWGTAAYPENGGSASSARPSSRFGPGARTLSEAQIQNAIKLLKSKNRHDVLIVTITGEGDGPQVAEQLTVAFSNAGWDVFSETSETRFISGVNIGEGIHFVGQDTEHESVQIAWGALRDTPARPASILPVTWKTVTPGSGKPQLGPPLTIVIGIP